MMLHLLLGVALAAETLTLDQAWEAAGTTPAAALARTEAELGRAEQRASRAWTNPSLDYQGFSRVRGTADAINGQQHQLDVGISLPITGELPARLERGRLAAARGAANADTAYLDAGAAISSAWLELLALQEREQVLSEATEHILRLIDLTEKRAADGAARRWDVDRLRLAHLSTSRQLALVRQQRTAASSTLAALLAQPSRDLEARGELSASLGHDRVSSREPSPFVVAADLDADYHAAGAREARRSRIPEPELRLGSYWTTDGDSSSVVASVAWDLPVFDRGQGRVAEAEAARAAASARRAQTSSWLDLEQEAVQQALLDLTPLVSTAAPPSSAVLDAAEVAWREGEASVLELVDAINSDMDQRLDAIDMQLALRHLELRAMTLDGTLLARLPPPR